jgi:redox-sensitive bicupin YhaK (pirin superfamily)
LSPGRSAWVHLVEGEATLGGVLLGAGDGAGVVADRAVSLTAREKTEILLLDLSSADPSSLSELAFERNDSLLQID